MSARRQPSTTSLAKYARTTSPDTSTRNFDFCNAFWGVGDGGVDVLFARMRGAARTVEELRNFWKERYVVDICLATSAGRPSSCYRSSIEEDYAKRLAKLAKMPIGKDEIGCVHSFIALDLSSLPCLLNVIPQGTTQFHRYPPPRDRQTSRFPLAARPADPHRPRGPGRRIRLQAAAPQKSVSSSDRARVQEQADARTTRQQGPRKVRVGLSAH